MINQFFGTKYIAYFYTYSNKSENLFFFFFTAVPFSSPSYSKRVIIVFMMNISQLNYNIQVITIAYETKAID